MSEETTRARANRQPVERSILCLLRAAGPLTGREIADELGLPYQSTANRCCEMVHCGDLTERPNLAGSWRGRFYVAEVDLAQRDRKLLREMVRAYGAEAVARAIAEVEP